MFATFTAHNAEFNATYRTCIAFKEGAINRIMLRGVFCAHKPYFLMPGHNYNHSYKLIELFHFHGYKYKLALLLNRYKCDTADSSLAAGTIHDMKIQLNSVSVTAVVDSCVLLFNGPLGSSCSKLTKWI